MKSLLALWQTVAQDLGGLCRVSTVRDCKTVADRVEDEGESFLTLTLPQFGKDLERSLALERIAPDAFTGFRRRGGLPLFLGGFLAQIFDTKSGVILDEACPSAVFAVRQLAGLCAKVERECTPRRVAAAYDKYIECESHVRTTEDYLRADGASRLADFARVGRLLFARVYTRADGQVANFGLVPNHGPGSTANGLGGNAKFDCFEWTARMDRVFPSSEYLVPNVRFHVELDRADMREPGNERPVKVIHVPKTLKTPRIIAMEPSYMMFMQQALWREFKSGLESDDLVGPMIGFTEQEPNRHLAQVGSTDGSLATLDLSEASDRVSNLLVETLLANHPHLREGVAATRSTHADVRGHGVIPLAKFASMGSALCFPFEAMVFLAIVLLGVERADGTKLTRDAVKRLQGRVRVYGDDIIVPVDYAEHVVDELEAFGLVVNRSKSFWTGRFRESCGGDYFRGTKVTPIRVRRDLPKSRADVPELESAVSFRNQAFELGCMAHTVRMMDRFLEKLLNGVYPEVGPDSPVLGRLTHGPVMAERTSPSLHRREVRGWIAVPKKRRNPLDGVGALTKYFLNAGDLPVTDKEHLEYSGRPVAVTLKRRWVRAD